MTDSVQLLPRKSDWRWLVIPGLVVLTALLMGLPTLRGTFVGGDDHRLVLNHVYVNHPSFEHAIDLFRIVHRDLYQPIPLLSFQMEFSVAGAMGLLGGEVDSFAWLFHLTNIWLHAVNALLVWLMVRSVCTNIQGVSRETVAGLAGLLFAVHPLQVEVVAWLNGRMMLLSTMFALLAVWSMVRWLTISRHRWAYLTVLFTLLCAISKIRVGLPVILIALPFVMDKRVTRRVITVWAVCVVVTAVFVVVNYRATADAGMFAGAAEHMLGSHIVRGLRSLAWYIEHFIWPVGLASWYPAPGMVAWSDRETFISLIVVAPVLALAVILSCKSRKMMFGFGWFFATIAVTLQLVPTRNTLAADRYMYLPIIGLLLVVALGCERLAAMMSHRMGQRRGRLASGFVVSVLTFTMIAVSWHTAWYYENPVRKAQRLAQLNPEALHVWERLAWAYHHDEQYALAIETARKELSHHDSAARSAAYLVIGVTQHELGQYDKAIESYKAAIAEDPKSARPVYRLALTYETLGQSNEALTWMEKAVEMAPLKNPWINRLASVYRLADRRDDARRLYEQSLRNNPFEVPATIGLAELDAELGTRESYQAAADRLEQLLEWMPENVAARVNLGVVYYALGRTRESANAYLEALKYEPLNLTALLNLGQLHAANGDAQTAWRYYQDALRVGLESVNQVEAVHDFLTTQGQASMTQSLWNDYLLRHPESSKAKSFLIWSAALSGDKVRAKKTLTTLTSDSEKSDPLVTATRIYLALVEKDVSSALEHTEALCGLAASGASARQRLQRRLADLLLVDEDWPWVYCIAARLLIASSDASRAKAFIEFGSERCKDERCQLEIARLQDLLSELETSD